MKKAIILILSLFVFIPFIADAKTDLSKYKYTNLAETAKLEGYTTHTSNNDADDVKIFLFWGDGCPHCSEFIKYINEYDKENDNIQLYAFEVWYEKANSALISELEKEFNVTIKGVPFIVIGDQYFSGFAEGMKSKMEEAIKKTKTSKNYPLTITTTSTTTGTNTTTKEYKETNTTTSSTTTKAAKNEKAETFGSRSENKTVNYILIGASIVALLVVLIIVIKCIKK